MVAENSIQLLRPDYIKVEHLKAMMEGLGERQLRQL